MITRPRSSTFLIREQETEGQRPVARLCSDRGLREMEANMTMISKSEADASAAMQDPRWASVVARDKTTDGEFWYSVATTGIFCRPSCPSRAANPKNVRFHATVAEAEAA